MNKWLKDHTPPGMSLGHLRLLFWGGLIVGILYSFGFLTDYFNAARTIEHSMERQGLVYCGEMMPFFSQLISGKFVVLHAFGWIFAVVAERTCTAYFRREAQSYYVMRRLSSRKEMDKRCTSLAAAGLLTYAAVVLLLYLLYLGIYFWCAPEAMIPEQTIGLFWRYVP